MSVSSLVTPQCESYKGLRVFICVFSGDSTVCESCKGLCVLSVSLVTPQCESYNGLCVFVSSLVASVRALYSGPSLIRIPLIQTLANLNTQINDIHGYFEVH